MAARELLSMLRAMELGEVSAAELLAVVGNDRQRVLALTRLLGCRSQIARLDIGELGLLVDGLLLVGGSRPLRAMVLDQVDADPSAIGFEREAADMIRLKIQ